MGRKSTNSLAQRYGKIGLIVFALIFAVSIGGMFPQTAYACPAGQHDTGRNSNRGVEDCVPDAAAPASSVDPVDAAVDVAGGIALQLTPFGPLLNNTAMLMWIIFKIASLLLGVAGVLFNFTVGTMVFEFSKYLGNSPGMTVAWGILRDFGNIGLLFGFVFMGISTVLDLHSYPWKKTLPKLVIAAILLNFSLFMAEAVVDTTNVLAATLYDQTYGGDTDGNCRQGHDWLGCFVNTGLGGIFLERIKITSAFGGGVETGDFGATLAGIADHFVHPMENILKYVGLSILATVAAVVLFAGAFMLLSRAVVLAFLMVTSPIGIAGGVIPGLEKLAEDWWKKLIDQALFAPVFILLLLVALKMTDGLASLNSRNGLAGIFATDASDMGSLLIYVLMCGFMISALMLASRFGIYGADLAIKTAGGAVYGTMGAIGRRTIGRYAFNKAQNLRGTSFGRTGLGRLVVGGYDAVGKGNFDGRSNPLFKSVTGATKLDLGKAQKGGFEHIVHDEAKKLADYGKTLKQTPEEKEAVEKLKVGQKETEGAAKQNILDAANFETSIEQQRADREAKIEQARGSVGGGQEAAQRLRGESTQLDADISKIASRISEEIAKGNNGAVQGLTKELYDKEKDKRDLDSRATSLERSLPGAQQYLSRLTEENRKLAETEASALAARKENLVKEQAFFRTAAENYKSSIDAMKTAPQRNFARSLRDQVDEKTLAGWALRQTAAGPHEKEVYKHAAHDLEDWAGKSGLERTLETLTETMKNQGVDANRNAKKLREELHEEHKDEGGGGADHH